MLEPMTGHVSEVLVDAFMHVVLSKAEKHVPCREPLNLWRYGRDVALTEVIITEFHCILLSEHLYSVRNFVI